jgi:hypothetical protein
VTLILFTIAPHSLTDELTKQGHEVYDAIAISEVLALAGQHPASSIVITPDVDQNRVSVIQQHYPTVRLRKQFTALYVSLN